MDHCHLYTLYIRLLYHILGAHAWGWCEGAEGQRLRVKWMKKSGVRSGGVLLEMVERHDFYSIQRRSRCHAAGNALAEGHCPFILNMIEWKKVFC